MNWKKIPVVMICMDAREEVAAMENLCRAGLPFGDPNLFPAVNGFRVGAPPWFKGTSGAWGCWRSHLSLWERMLSDGTEALAVFEEDVVTHEDAREHVRIAEFLQRVPDDWDMVYLGGQVWQGPQPERVADGVYRSGGLLRTHAYVVKNTASVNAAYHRLCTMQPSVRGQKPMDYVLADMMESGQLRVYMPGKWFCGQAAGTSRTKGDTRPELWWEWQ